MLSYSPVSPKILTFAPVRNTHWIVPPGDNRTFVGPFCIYAARAPGGSSSFGVGGDGFGVGKGDGTGVGAGVGCGVGVGVERFASVLLPARSLSLPRIKNATPRPVATIARTRIITYRNLVELSAGGGFCADG